MATQQAIIILAKNTAAGWSAANPIGPMGAQMLETDTGKIKIGDGITAWADLIYNTDPALLLSAVRDGDVISGGSAAEE